MVELILYLLGAWMHWKIFLAPHRKAKQEITGVHIAMVIFWPVCIIVDMLCDGWIFMRYHKPWQRKD